MENKTKNKDFLFAADAVAAFSGTNKSSDNVSRGLGQTIFEFRVSVPISD